MSYRRRGAALAITVALTLGGTVANAAVRTVPGAPQISRVFATCCGAETIRVEWTSPASDGGSAITKNTITPYDGDVAQPTFEVGGDPGFAEVTGLTRSVIYTFTIAASNAVGRGPASERSGAAMIEAARPGSPATVHARARDASAEISWTPPVDDGGARISAYTVKSAASGTGCDTLGELSCTVIGLTNGTSYTFTVQAVNRVGPGRATTTNAVTPQPASVPDAPTGVQADGGDGSAVLRWTAPANDGGAGVSGYIVSSSPSSGGCSTAGATTCTVSGLANGTLYRFLVRAVNTAGEGPAGVSGAVVPGGTTRLTITSAPRRVIFGNAAVVAGRLVAADARALHGRPVTLQYRATDSAPWLDAGSRRSSPAGTVRFAGFRPRRSMQVRLHFAGANGWHQSVSTARRIHVAPHVTGHLGAHHLHVGATTTAFGAVTPARLHGARVVLQRLTAGGWATVSTSRLDGTARYLFTVHGRRAGALTIRAMVPAAHGMATGLGPRRFVLVG